MEFSMTRLKVADVKLVISDASTIAINKILAEAKAAKKKTGVSLFLYLFKW